MSNLNDRFSIPDADEENITSEKQNGDVEDTVSPTANDAENKTSSKKTYADEIIDKIAAAVKEGARNSDKGLVESLVKKLIGTIFSMNTLDEYATGIRVEGQLYRFEEYSCIPELASLVIAKKVVASDVMSAYDLCNHQKYDTKYGVCTPGEFLHAQKVLMNKLRLNSEMSTLSRPSTELLGSAVQFAVNGKQVSDKSNKTIYFLKHKFDDEARVSIDEWCRHYATKLLK